MFLFKPAASLAIVSSLMAATVDAQPVDSPPGPSTAPPMTSPGAYRSALEGYQPYREQKIQPWKQANDTVGQVGGWRAYAQEAAEPANQGGAAPAPSATAHPHAEHGRR